MKYLVNDTYWSGAKANGPIFFYCGNEGAIELFYENTGFITNTLAKEYNALIVYAEHRYFGNGTSLPFGNKSFDNITTLRYLTTE